MRFGKSRTLIFKDLIILFFFKRKKPEIKTDSERIIPKHIGIIMDGNGRWAKRRGLPKSAGHKAGADVLKRIAEYCDDLGVEAITAYAFSTENWSRPQKEVDYLMNLMYSYLKDAPNLLAGKKAKIRVVGNTAGLSQKIRDEIVKTEAMTKNNTGLWLNLAVNDGGREEITHAARILAEKAKSGEINPADITENTLSELMYTNFVPDPDVIIRPSGELRLSNFMLWQAAYSEFWFSDVCWPDFSERDIDRMIDDFNKRDRRFGGRKDEE